MSETNKLPILKASQHAWGFASRNWMPTLPAFLILAVLGGVMFMVSTSEGAQEAGLALPAMLAYFAVYIMIIASIFRRSLNRDTEGFLGLKVSGDEGRLLLANVLYGLGFFVLGFVLFFVIFFLVGSAFLFTTIDDMEAIADDQVAFQQAIFDAFQTPTGAVFAVVMVILFAIPMLWFVARLITFQPATIAYGKVMIFQTWNWTRGYAFQIVGAILLAAGPFWLLHQLGLTLAALSIGQSPFFWVANPEVILPRPSAFLFGFANILFSIPLTLIWGGLAAFMYRGFDPDYKREENTF